MQSVGVGQAQQRRRLAANERDRADFAAAQFVDRETRLVVCQKG